MLEHGGKTVKIKVFSPEALPGFKGGDAVPGTVVTADSKEGLTVRTGSGAVRIGEVQLPGRKRMKTSDFFKGNSIVPGTILGAQQA